MTSPILTVPLLLPLLLSPLFSSVSQSTSEPLPPIFAFTPSFSDSHSPLPDSFSDSPSPLPVTILSADESSRYCCMASRYSPHDSSPITPQVSFACPVDLTPQFLCSLAAQTFAPECKTDEVGMYPVHVHITSGETVFKSPVKSAAAVISMGLGLTMHHHIAKSSLIPLTELYRQIEVSEILITTSIYATGDLAYTAALTVDLSVAIGGDWLGMNDGMVQGLVIGGSVMRSSVIGEGQVSVLKHPAELGGGDPTARVVPSYVSLSSSREALKDSLQQRVCAVSHRLRSLPVTGGAVLQNNNMGSGTLSVICDDGEDICSVEVEGIELVTFLTLQLTFLPPDSSLIMNIQGSSLDLRVSFPENLSSSLVIVWNFYQAKTLLLSSTSSTWYGTIVAPRAEEVELSAGSDALTGRLFGSVLVGGEHSSLLLAVSEVLSYPRFPVLPELQPVVTLCDCLCRSYGYERRHVTSDGSKPKRKPKPAKG